MAITLSFNYQTQIKKLFETALEIKKNPIETIGTFSRYVQYREEQSDLKHDSYIFKTNNHRTIQRRLEQHNNASKSLKNGQEVHIVYNKEKPENNLLKSEYLNFEEDYNKKNKNLDLLKFLWPVLVSVLFFIFHLKNKYL